MDVIENADVRLTDPLTSHLARDRAVKSERVALLIEKALESANRPLVADEIHRVIRQELGGKCSGPRVRTVLSENNGGPWERLDAVGVSHMGNKSHLWWLKDE